MLTDYLRLVANSILIIGPALAGKSTMLWRLKTGVFNENLQPTIGFMSDTVRNTSVVEIGGQSSYKEFWQLAFDKKPPLVLFVIDVTKESNFKEYLDFMKVNYQLTRVVLVANKIDLLGEDNQIYNQLSNLGIEVIACSVRTGKNFWRLSEYVAEFCSKFNPLDDSNTKRSNDNTSTPSEEKKRKLDKERVSKLLDEYDGKF
jgi:GTPase SAR1 family protein